MTRDTLFKLLTLFFGIVAILAIGACTVTGLSTTSSNFISDEPAVTVVPTPTEAAQESTPTPSPEPEDTPTPEPESTPTPVPTEAEDGDGGESEAALESEDASESDEDAAEPDEQEAAEPAQPAEPGRPVELRIDKIGVTAPFEWVGVNEQGDMEAPEGWNNAAWYEPGPAPGAQGNSVITGHYDAPGGVAAIFYNLRSLAPGDHVTIISEYNEELVFEVTNVESVHVSEAPLERIFGDTDEHNLNLITCEGAWDPSAGMYDQRLIVYTTLVSG